MAIIGIILILLFVFSILYLEHCDNVKKKNKYKEECLKRDLELAEKNRAREIKLEKEKIERRKHLEELEKANKIAKEKTNQKLNIIKQEFKTPRYLILISKLKERYPLVEFNKFENDETLKKFLSSIADLSTNDVKTVETIFKNVSKFCYLSFNKTWDCIVPLSNISNIYISDFIEVQLPDNWSAIREWCFQRDNGKCRRCGLILSPFLYQVHHIIPRSRNGNHELNNLVTLCIDCHSLQGGGHEELKRNRMDIDNYLNNIICQHPSHESKGKRN